MTETTIAIEQGGGPMLGVAPPEDVLLDVRDLKTYFHVMDGTVRAVDGVSFSLKRGSSIGVVGESGSGKSVTALTMMRLLDIPPAEIVDGEIWFDGRELVAMSDEDIRHIRGKDMAMIFQEPLTALNPLFTVGDQISEQIQLHMKVKKREAWDRSIEMLKTVGIPNAETRVKQYPHEMSGGMRQRVMIAMAISCEPKLIIADEPTTALDVTIQAQIMELLKSIQQRTGASLMLITHDLGVIAEMVDDVIVMYAGQVVEQGHVDEVFLDPRAPYTVGLIRSIPSVVGRGRRLKAIRGTVPSPFNLPPACRFEPRCDYPWDLCRATEPELYQVGAPERGARCHLYGPAGRGHRSPVVGTASVEGETESTEAARPDAAQVFLKSEQALEDRRQ